MLELPITPQAILRGVTGPSLVENETHVATRPRVSSVASCARKTLYDMHGIEESHDWGRDEAAFTQEQGRLAEDITISGIDASGLVRVVNRQVELNDASPATGHPDGELEFRAYPDEGPHPDDDPGSYEVPGWYDCDDNGRKWGFEHKHFGDYGFSQILKGGLFEGASSTITQVVLYGAARGWDACLVAITSQDASVVRRTMKQNRDAKKPKVRWTDDLDPNNSSPKLLLFAVDLRPLYKTLLPILDGRAAALAEAARELSPCDIVPEGEPFWQEDEDPKVANGSGFPCSYCEHWKDCTDDLQRVNPTVEIPKVRNA